MRRLLGRVLYRYGWDTRYRSREAVKVIRDVLGGDGLLDVGCGPGGLASFMPEIEVTGVDVDEPADPPPNLQFVRGSITDLPFEDRAFGVVGCVDTLEFLSPEDRTAGISELVRVADRAVVIPCPKGEVARSCDDRFRLALEARDLPVPSWISEPQPYPYPTLEEVV